MQLDDLRVLHRKRTSDQAVDPFFGSLPDAFHVGTCQRDFWAGTANTFAHLAELPADSEIFSGAEAYRFLLEVATGLRSQVRGETDIFGQIKSAWASTCIDSPLRGWIQRLFEDTKDIRARYMQNVGGASYGSLVRMVLKQNAQGPQEPILLVGAGQLAQSILPWLEDHELWLTNRSEAGLRHLEAELAARPGTRYRAFHAEENHHLAWEKAAHIVICVPASDVQDPARVEALLNHTSPNRRVIHLGIHEAQGTPWKKVPNLFTLNDVFALQKKQDQHRGSLFERAEQACAEKSRLRELASHSGGPVSLPHGWEDLAVFERIG